MSASARPKPDPTRKAFEKISVGDCLDSYMSPSNHHRWTKGKPHAVACGRPDAYVRVTDVVDDSSDCAEGDGEIDGELWWDYGDEGDEIALCVRRQLRVGDCFLATDGAEEGTVAISNPDLMTSWPCGKRPLPGTTTTSSGSPRSPAAAAPPVAGPSTGPSAEASSASGSSERPDPRRSRLKHRLAGRHRVGRDDDVLA